MAKDWVGNQMAMFATLGASSHSENDRAFADYYATPPQVVEELLKREEFCPYIWEPAVGGGHIADVLKKHGYKVRCSDLIDHGYDCTEVIDFLQTARGNDDCSMDIITNPPYSIATEFVQHAMDISLDGAKVAMFLKIQFLETKKKIRTVQKVPT